MVVWNVAVLPDSDDLLEAVHASYAGAPLDIRLQFRILIKNLIESRRSTYAHDRRLIGDFQVEAGAPGELRVSVAYATLPASPAVRA